MKKENFDLLLQLHGNGTITNSLLEKFAAKQVAGFYEGSEAPGDLFIPYPNTLHETDRLLSLIEFLGIPIENDSLEYPLHFQDYVDFQQLAHIFHIPHDYIVVHPGSQLAQRRWDPKHFATVADVFAQKGYTIIITGTENEKELAKQVQAHMKSPSIDLMGETTLGTLGVLIQYARLLVANDTGVSHIATALKKKSVIIFSPYSDQKRWAPKDPHRHVVISPKYSYSPMYAIAAAEKLLDIHSEEVYI
jgi:ADP-heptose:LPS heptosyltransferase